MNELNQVRALLREPPPPSASVRTAALRSLEDGIAGRAPRSRRTGPRPVRPRLRLGLTGLTGLVAAGAATAVAVAALGGGGTGPSPSASPPEGELSARSVLLAAAEHAAKEPTGRYWRVQTVDGQAYRVGGAENGYTVLGYSVQSDEWRARSMDDPDMLYGRDLGARPLTPADAAAWKKAGSPKTFRVWSNDHWATLSTKPGETLGSLPARWSGESTTPAAKRAAGRQAKKICAEKKPVDGPDFGGKCDTRSPEEVERLVSDPKTVEKLLFGTSASSGAQDAGRDLMNSLDLLTRTAAPPTVRAAVFRALAKRPGVRVLGKVRDPKGRPGIALAARSVMQEGSGTVFDDRLVLEEGTYRILSNDRVVVRPGGRMRGMRPGDVLSQQVFLGIGWTNESPHHP
ncbi:CU044_5270 family protein [Actinomadura hibisca]|uniref:CU044_5270 family protein n=1 Tax=Actinomadura hibisca TaxID=68565 RepID=UPI00082C1268|nr:CU044_5270 family protein [Actinomadura hibisca]